MHIQHTRVKHVGLAQWTATRRVKVRGRRLPGELPAADVLKAHTPTSIQGCNTFRAAPLLLSRVPRQIRACTRASPSTITIYRHDSRPVPSLPAHRTLRTITVRRRLIHRRHLHAIWACTSRECAPLQLHALAARIAALASACSFFIAAHLLRCPPCFQSCRWQLRSQYRTARHPAHNCCACGAPHDAHSVLFFLSRLLDTVWTSTAPVRVCVATCTSDVTLRSAATPAQACKHDVKTQHRSAARGAASSLPTHDGGMVTAGHATPPAGCAPVSAPRQPHCRTECPGSREFGR